MQSKHRGAFTKELRALLYAFGDVSNPRQDTVDLLEDMMVDYIAGLVERTLVHAATIHPPSTTSNSNGSGVEVQLPKLRVADMLAVLREEDDKKAARAEELLYMSEEIRRARKIDMGEGTMLPDDQD